MGPLVRFGTNLRVVAASSGHPRVALRSLASSARGCREDLRSLVSQAHNRLSARGLCPFVVVMLYRCAFQLPCPFMCRVHQARVQAVFLPLQFAECPSIV